MTEKADEAEGFEAFATLAQESRTVFAEALSGVRLQLYQTLFLRLVHVADQTSAAIQLVAQQGLPAPALALLRVRFEQVVVCSYLIHEDRDAGLARYMLHTPIASERLRGAVAREPSLESQLAATFPRDDFRQKAIDAQREIDPSFSAEADKLQRGWTSLDLRAMASRRDFIVKDGPRIVRERLEREYQVIYRVCSSIVHSDSLSISHQFFREVPAESGVSVAFDPSWALLACASVSFYDILQRCEVLRYLGLQNDERFDEIYARWLQARTVHI